MRPPLADTFRCFGSVWVEQYHLEKWQARKTQFKERYIKIGQIENTSRSLQAVLRKLQIFSTHLVRNKDIEANQNTFLVSDFLAI